MLGSSKIALVGCLFSLYFSGLVNGVPIASPQENALAARATAPTTVLTSQMVETSQGTMMETCTITLTPDSSGSYQEVKSCTMSPVVSSAADSPAASATATGAVSVATAAATAPPAIIVDGESSIASTAVFPTSAIVSASAAEASATAAPGTASAPGALESGAASDSNGTPINNAAGPGTATASAAVNSSSATPLKKSAVAAAAVFVVPGRHLLVLPVGLIIYCVLTGITILIVLLMTIERMRYRRAFRQRKLAEQGAAMGYGGMGKV